MYALSLPAPGLSFSGWQKILNPFLIVALLFSLIAPALTSWPWTAGAANDLGTTLVTDARAAKTLTFPEHSLPSLNVNAPVAPAAESASPATTWNGHAEIIERRTDFVRHYDLGDGRAVAVVGAKPWQEQAAVGQGRPLAPSLEVVDGGFVVQHDALRSSLSAETSLALLQHEQTALGWQPQALVALDAQGTSRQVLAQPFSALADPPAKTVASTELSADGRTLTYRNHWSDATLQETFVSAPGSLEQSLILSAAPTVASQAGMGWFDLSLLRNVADWSGWPFQPAPPAWLALETDLYLLSGETLWVNGQTQTTRFTTLGGEQQALELRNAAGETVLALAPVLAYEQNNPAAVVAGHYEGELLEENVWRLRAVTPWAWWADPVRVYPAVLDPEFVLKVNQPTQISSEDCRSPVDAPFAEPECTTSDQVVVATRRYHGEDFGVGSLLAEGRATSDITFGQLPSLPAANIDESPEPTLPGKVTIVTATLVISGSMYGQDFEIEMLDLTDPAQPVAATTLSHEMSINGKNAYNCHNRLWGGNFCNDATRISILAEFDLPDTLINRWYQGGEAALRLQAAGGCDPVVSRITPEEMTVGCDFVQATEPQLLLYYAEATLGQEIYETETPSHGDDFTATHKYRLQPPPAAWWAVAGHLSSNGGQDVTDAQVLLNANTDFDLGEEPVFGQYAQGHRTNYFVMDKTNPGQGTETWVTVDGDADNAAGARYALQGIAAELLENPTAQGAPQHVFLNNGSPLSLFSFTVEPRHTLYISITTGVDLAPELFPPRPGTGNGKTRDVVFAQRRDGFDSHEPRDIGGGQNRYVIEAASESDESGTWALVLARDNPITQNVGDFGALVTIELIACPDGYYFAERFNGCQPLIYPHLLLIPPPGHGIVPIPPTAFEDITTNGASVRIFSEGGFTTDTDPATYGHDATGAAYARCTQREDLGMPLLGVPGDAASPTPPERLIAVQQGSVCITQNNRIEITAGPGYGALVGPSYRKPNVQPAALYNYAVQVHIGRIFPTFGGPYQGRMAQDESNPLILRRIAGARGRVSPWAAWPGMETVERWIAIDQRVVHGRDQGTLSLTNGAPDNPVSFAFASSWQVASDFANQGFTFNAETATTPPNLDVASLTARFHAPAELATSFSNKNATIDEILLTNATIHQSEQAGAAYRPVQAVILKEGDVRKAEGKPCEEPACLEVRNANNIESPEWRMPDIDIGGPVGSLIVQSAGNLQLFSNDHPDTGKLAAAGLTAANFAQSFNFKTFSGTVSVEEAVCITGEEDEDYQEEVEYPKVLVIKGSTDLALPTLGDGSSGGPGLHAEFTLCESKLRHVYIRFSAYPPGLAVGASGMIVKQIDGEVWVNPEFVKIQVGVNFESADGKTFSNGGANMIIDTRGYFELAGGGQLVSVFDLEGRLQVAWNPLDILQEAELSYRDWLRGYLRLHAWRGQGWQNKYHWLPDNHDFHFTGAIGAELTLKQGRIGQFFGVMIPRHDIVFAVEVSFGEFCSNSTCTRYEWGVQGKLTVFSFTVGMFLGNRSGVEFFVGDRGKVLIDQAFDVQAASVQAVPNGLVSDLADGATLDFSEGTSGPCPLENGVATCTFTVEPDTGEALITVAWNEGTLPTAILHTPDGMTIRGNAPGATPLPVENVAGGAPIQAWEMAAGGAVQFSLDATGALYTIENPQPGNWILRLENLIGYEDYNVLFAANSPPPQLTLTAPNHTQTSDTLDIQWTVSAAPADATVHLAYLSATEYISYTNGLAAGVPITKQMSYRSGVTLAPSIPAANGSYQWQPAGLASGDYYIVARIDHPIHGASYSFSPGPFTYIDSTPPAVPGGLLLYADRGARDGLILSWNRNADRDLYAYEVVYNSPNLDAPAGFIERRLRMTPSNAGLTHPTRESTRLVGLLEGVATTVCVRAIDASGNASECSPPVTGAPQLAGFNIWIKPELTMLQSGPGSTLAAQWNPGVHNDGFLLSWGYGCNSTFDAPTAAQGPTNLDVGNVTSFQLTGLPPGTYRVAVRGYRSADQFRQVITEIGDHSNSLRTMLTDGVDGDGDNLPDDWATHFGVHGAAEDPDKDGLQNAYERLHATDPTNADSDADGFSDGDETFKWFTDPCDPQLAPDRSRILRMVVAPEEPSLRFETVVGHNPGDGYAIRVWALGRGQLRWTASASQPWIRVTPAAGADVTWLTEPSYLEVTVDVSGLAPGYHEGTVRIQSDIGGPVHGSPQDVPVRLWVQRNGIEPKTNISGYVFLDKNGNGVEDPDETNRVEEVTVSVVNRMGAVMQQASSLADTGEFAFAMLPYAGYVLAASHANAEFVVTTPNPLPVQLTPENNMLTGVKIGIVRQALGSNPLDSDGDTISDQAEDRNGDGQFDNDDSDGDGTPDYRDEDDDNDGILTLVEGSGDRNGNGVPDYLDRDTSSAARGMIFLPLVMR